MNTKILIVDDEIKIRNLISKYAAHEGYGVIEASDGLEAVDKALNNDIDLIIMDVMMPNMDGFTAYTKIKDKKDVPVIFLTALNEEYNCVYGFDIGADDYVSKPFSTNELMRRVKAVLKRTANVSEDVIVIDDLLINKTAHEVRIKNELLSLSLKEYDLLLYLVENRGIALSRESILEKVWGYDYFKDDRTLDTHIKLLRKSLGDYAKYITTIRGVGYRFEKTI